MESIHPLRSTNGWKRRLAAGTVVGVLAYGVNYGVMRWFLAMDGATWEEAYSSVIVSNPMLKFTGQTLYNAHFVGTRFTGDTGSVTIRNFVTDASIQTNLTSAVPAIIYLLAPILVLTLAGYLLSPYPTRPTSWNVAAKNGLCTVPGYLVLSIGGMLYFSLSGGFVISNPDPIPAILLAGIVYPALWGGAGAMIGYERHRG